MRTLLILGGLVVVVLLVTPSNGERRVSQDGGEKKSMDSRDLMAPAGPSESRIRKPGKLSRAADGHIRQTLQEMCGCKIIWLATPGRPYRQ
ncbi:unnamed protein product [Staurois parvus]|uniref:Uncharacterized protein n=1 Tax=Staurois parvus TaxID=386267 RepID=A0ABN9B4D5_9NEOB|nr:unnamed protein product [Staurois parvus]